MKAFHRELSLECLPRRPHSWHPQPRSLLVSAKSNPAGTDRPGPNPRRIDLHIVASEAPARHPAPQSIPGPSWAKRYRLYLLLTDFSIIIVALIAVPLAQITIMQSTTASTIPQEYWYLAALAVTLWAIMLSLYQTRDARVVGVGVGEYKAVVHATTVMFGLGAIGSAVLGAAVPDGHFLVALPLGLLGLVVSRWVWRKWLIRQRAYGHYLAHAIVVGERRDVEYVIGQIDHNSGAAYLIVGAVLDDESDAPIQVKGRQVPVVCDLDHVADAARQLHVDTVIVASQPRDREQFIRDLGWALEGTAAELVLANRLTNVAGPRIHFRPVEGLPLMHVELPYYAGGKHTVKRLFDCAAAACGLAMLLPALLVLAVLIRIDTPGSPFFRQTRVGRDGKPFGMLKFRSMVVGAEDQLAGLLDKNEGAGVLFKMTNDPRVTRCGKVMRKYSLDELPQLWNVLIGQMSLVGPRPPLAREVAAYEKHVNRRLYIKPGITGMWQINGRSDLDWDESVRLDLYYVENWSITGDLVILWRTLRVLRQHSGAY